MTKFSSFLSTLALFPMLALGEGSVARADLDTVLMTNPVLAQALGESLLLSDVGTATRLGNHVGNLGGARIGPYEFEATLKKPGSESAKVLVTLYTDVKFRDPSGQVILFDNIRPETLGLTISEKLLRYEVAAEPPFTPPPVAADGLTWQEFKLPLGAGESGNYRRGMLDGELKELEVNYDEGDNIGWTFKIGFGANKLPNLVIASSSTSREVAPGQYVDQIKTRVLDYENGSLVKARSSDATDELGLPVNFEDLNVTTVAANRVYRVALQMKVSEGEVLAALVQDAIDAQNRLNEPLVSSDDPRWKPVDFQGRLLQVNSQFTTTAAALYFVRQLNLLPAATSPEQPTHLWTDALSLRDGVTMVLVTASGYEDDEIEGERFLVAITQIEDGWALRGVSKQVKKWRGEDWE